MATGTGDSCFEASRSPDPEASVQRPTVLLQVDTVTCMWQISSKTDTVWRGERVFDVWIPDLFALSRWNVPLSVHRAARPEQ